ncbi:MAG: hypothetical protein IJ164_09175 [Duodenibacillus sp.]|nr:hypothetical protein [Duodenibacillus sp.]
MPIYINGRPVNPIVSLLASAAVIAFMIALGIFLLPLIGGLFVFGLFVLLAFALYGAYWRWRHGDPIDNLRKQMAQAEAAMRGETPEAARAYEEPKSASRSASVQAVGVRRTVVVEDAEVVEEIDRPRKD